MTDPPTPGHGVGMDRWIRRITPSLLVAVSMACTPSLGKLGDVADEPSGESEGEELPPAEERVAVLELDDRALDLLFVIDNSGSMGARQASATAAISRFVDLAAAVDLDLRIGFTTTDNGNPWCAGTSPEGGQLRLSACTSRLHEFIFEGVETISAEDEACLDSCALSEVLQRATTTHVDDQASVRPWIEMNSLGGNLDGVTAKDAIGCVASQGIDGCGFESPLESMRKSIERSRSPSDPMYGFLRPWARFAVVFVTDEVDCSVESTWEEIFLPEGNRVFWGDPGAAAPSSSVCWNAGVQCQAESGDLGSCNPQNYDVEGNVTDAAGAVMRSLTHYIEDLHAVETSKALYRPEGAGSVSVGLIGGVPSDYTQLRYQRGIHPDTDFTSSFGVDPGCTDSSGGGVPPVRLRALAELFAVEDAAVIHSICDSDYEPALERFAAAVATESPNIGCVPGCLADTQSEQSGTQAQCEVIMTYAGAMTRESVFVPGCDAADPSEVCYVLRLDNDATACEVEGSNAELELVMPESFLVRGQATVEVVCEMASEGSC